MSVRPAQSARETHSGDYPFTVSKTTKVTHVGEFKLILISAGFEHGGNVVHRHLDGHPDLLVYPFESQFGNRSFTDFLASVERVQYRYPEFPEGLRPKDLYEEIIDEELKTFLRKRNGSKFKDVDLQLAEKDRIDAFVRFLGDASFYPRARVIESLFRATFVAWTNYYTSVREGMSFVGYSPAIGIDAERIVRDFPNVRILHVVRNPFSAFRDTKRRPFPQSITKYLISWNIYHSTVEMYTHMFPDNVRIFRYEDLVANKETFMRSVADFIGVPYSPTMVYPSWNGVELTETIAPWGTVLRCTQDYNASVIRELDQSELKQIARGTTALARHFGYDKVGYLREYYGAE